MRMQLMKRTRANPDSSIDHEPYIFFQNFVLSSLPEFSFSLICHCLCSFLPELLFSIVNVQELKKNSFILSSCSRPSLRFLFSWLSMQVGMGRVEQQYQYHFHMILLALLLAVIVHLGLRGLRKNEKCWSFYLFGGPFRSTG